MENAIATFTPSNNAIVSGALTGLENVFHQAAEANINNAIQASGQDDYTAIEKRAMVMVEQLKLYNGVDLAAVLMRGKALKTIEEEALWNYHPEHYADLKTMARMIGISISELSNVRDLCDIIFPYMEETLEMDIPTVWENIGKANMRELVPVIKAMITGERPAHGSVATAVDRILEDTAATERAAGNNPTAEELSVIAIQSLIADGERMTARDLRDRVRPTRTPNINPTIVRRADTRIFMVELDNDQYLALQRKLGTFIEDPYEVDATTRIRRNMIAQIPVLRELTNIVE